MGKYKFYDLVEIVRKLRGEKGCPWDKKQTHKSLIKYLKEETEELIKEIEKDNIGGIKDELGDVLLQVVFHTQIEKEKGNFDIDDVIDSICRKMIRRHPHVFGNLKIKDEKEIIENWEKIKKMEKKGKSKQ
ncbi:MazG family protein [bacterium]|nr:MazG family protein [bacterium]